MSKRKRAEEYFRQAYYTLKRHLQRRTATLRRVNATLHVEVTKRKQAEEAIRQSDERFRRLVQESLQGILIHRAGTPVFANQAYAEMYGYDTPEDILRLENIFDEIIAPEDRARLYHYFQCRLRGEPAPTHYICRGVRRDGTYIWVENLITVVQWEGDIAIQCSVVDITEHKHAEYALRESEERFRNLIEGSLQGILIHRDDRALFVNKSYAAIFGYERPEEIYNLNSLLVLIAPHEHQRLLHYYHDRLAGKEPPTHYEYQGVRKDGALVWLDMQVRTIRWGGVHAVQSTIVDISERKRVEAERHTLENQLRQARKMESIGTLAGGIAHEFNNMLMVILGFTELAQTEIPANVTAGLYLQHVCQAGRRAQELVQQILTFSRASEQTRQPVQLVEVVQGALSVIRASLPSTIAIRTHFMAETSQVLANQTQVHQVMLNLCSNAEYAMRGTGGVLDITVDTVQIDTTWPASYPQLSPGAYVRLTVHDTGHGIAPEVKDRIFDPFFSTKGVGEGSGMGLAIVHGIVMSYNGVISIESMPGEGTTCTIYLPQYVRTQDEGRVPVQVDPRDTPGRGRILFVDDEEMLVRLAQAQLVHLGYEVVAHTTSLGALEAFRADPHGFALVITDQTMPTMTGATLVGELRHIRPDIPIILCTGFSHLIDEGQAQALGVDAFLMKPVATHEFAVIVRQVLDKRTAQAT